VKNNPAIAEFAAPMAFISPTSLRRSMIAVAIAAETAKAEASSAAIVTSSISPSMRERTLPSFCETCRISTARELGIACCTWKAIDLA
jgi:hypothetical protein